ADPASAAQRLDPGLPDRRLRSPERRLHLLPGPRWIRLPVLSLKRPPERRRLRHSEPRSAHRPGPRGVGPRPAPWTLPVDPEAPAGRLPELLVVRSGEP